MSAGQARQGQVFKGCTRCNTRVPERRCPKCGARDSFTWAFVVDVTPKDAQGHLIGKRRQKEAQGFATKAAAQDALNQLQVEKKAGTYIDPSRMTFGEYLDLWYADADAHGWEGSTKTIYGVAISLHTKPYAIATTPLQALTSMQFRAHYSWLLKHGKIRRNKKGEITYQGPLSPRTVLNVHIMYRAALNDAVTAEPPLLRKNVVVGTYTYNRRKNRREMLTWTVEEMRTFLDFTVQDPDHVMWDTDLMTGQRRGELLGMRRRDCLLNRVVDGKRAPAVNVRQQYARNGAEGLVFKSLKTGDTAWRTIDLDEETAALLRTHLEAQEFQRRSWGAAYTSRCPRCGKLVEDRCPTHDLKAADLDLVFCHPDGSPFDPDVVTGRFERLAELCSGAPRIRFHDMRHTHATLLLEDGATEKYVAERLGDTVQMIHETYGHVTPKMRAAAVDRLASRLAVRDRPVTEADSPTVGEAGPQ
jgi:integrase